MQSLWNYVRGGLTALLFMALGSLVTHSLSAASSKSTAPLRQYYLTPSAINGDHALTACNSGYHMASFGEISDLSNVSYNASLGRIAADSGFGPPNAAGWIRTGSAASVTVNATGANCNVWASASSTDYGTVALTGAFADSATTLVFGSASGTACDNSAGNNIGVWCVQD
jgi:hypothetical protein